METTKTLKLIAQANKYTYSEYKALAEEEVKEERTLDSIEVVGQKGEDPPQPTLVVKGHREAFSVAEVAEDPLLLSKR